jgi:hypothetical protein
VLGHSSGWLGLLTGLLFRYGGAPGADCAYVSAASSYFDRYWSQGNFQKRYFLHCVAEDAAAPRATSNAAINSAHSTTAGYTAA